MRASEFFDFINRTDLALGRNPKDSDYTHMSITMLVKRARYLHQKALRGEKPVK